MQVERQTQEPGVGGLRVRAAAEAAADGLAGCLVGSGSAGGDGVAF